jgi:hypothetical protein
MTKFTPGPWEVSSDGHAIESKQKNDAKHLHIANILQRNGMDENEVIANSTLISAAPDMYTVLKSIEWISAYPTLCPCCRERKTENGWYGHSSDCQLAAALRKAEPRV